MTNDPERISLADFQAALRVLRIDDNLETLAGIETKPGLIRVTRYRTNFDGHRYVAGKDAATVSIDIALDDTVPKL